MLWKKYVWVFSERDLRITVEYVSNCKGFESSIDVLGRGKEACKIQSPSRTWLIWGTISNSIEMAK